MLSSIRRADSSIGRKGKEECWSAARCVVCIWQSEGTGNASEGDPTWDTVPTKIINTSLPMPDSPSQPGHRRHLSGKGFAFDSNNPNMCKAISLRLCTPGHTIGHLATGVPFCALKQMGTTGPWIPCPTPVPQNNQTSSPAWKHNILNSFFPAYLQKFGDYLSTHFVLFFQL